MNVHDVSQEAEVASLLQRYEMMAFMSHLRKGHKVQDHPPRQDILARFYKGRNYRLSSTYSGRGHLITTQLPLRYPPCDRSVEELRPMRIAQMRLETHHRGAKTFLRVLTPPNRMNAILGIVEDQDGTAVTLQLYHHAPETMVPAEEVLGEGKLCVLKEPYFKCAADGSYSLRVDHIGDIVWLEPFDKRVPDMWREQPTIISSEAARMQGNEAVKKKEWAKALRLYSDAIRYAATPEEEQLASVNRSWVNLNLGRPEKALLNATATNSRIAPSEKALFREIRALYELRAYDRCLERLQQFSEKYPDNKDAKTEMERVKERLNETINGIYAFARMYKQAAQASAMIDCATFSAPIEVRTAPGRGRGLFTMKPIRAGDLLLCEKAFAYKYHDGSSGRFSILIDYNTRRAVAGSQAELLTQTIQNLYHNPDYSQALLQLHHKDCETVANASADGNPVVDSFLVANIMSMNVFGAPRTTRDAVLRLLNSPEYAKDTEGASDTAGIWLKASYVNHSCIENCNRSFIGDIQIVRATIDMDAGTELRFRYCRVEEMDSYDDVQRRLEKWGFSCDCAFCQAKRATSWRQLKRREALRKEFQDTFRLRGGDLLVKALALLDDMKRTYPMSCPIELPRFALSGSCFDIAMEYSLRRDVGKSVDMFVQGIEMLGYEIAAVWPHSKPGRGSHGAKFEIRRWGAVDESVPWALVKILTISRTIAPGISSRIREYAETAYSIVVGERETFAQIFPDAA